MHASRMMHRALMEKLGWVVVVCVCVVGGGGGPGRAAATAVARPQTTPPACLLPPLLRFLVLSRVSIQGVPQRVYDGT
jgi:hypothetical protein